MHHPRDRASEGGPTRFAILLLSLLLLTTASSLVPLAIGALVGNLAASAVLLAGLFSMYHRRGLLLVGMLLLTPALATRWVFFWLETPALAPISLAFWLLFTSYNAGALFVFIQRRGTPTNDTIYGGVCVYVLMGYCFGAGFALLETLNPGSFNFVNGTPESPLALEFQMAYFSLVTLSTLGYGDITPLSPVARSLAMVEAVVGPMFVAVFLARLVGVRTAKD
ncbi:ion channel [Lamprobacter modestohalophilus]|uniref:Ion transporter n=1 Tax=Lamprobacter modestohalophilus TaxID=1064514 RepID=A0A9X0WAA7_9GAMM|nr:potassium channel family protein [Lamprobacter modestohalophilus]MCF7977838.1 two pore domain potassium channel family protein [Chromatiaceae bacterium]MBK1619744.1 ion transporter [Lamprobacter modestohalophilus]MCF7995866.1 two pore domain potassium channel family protein [Chromatiaceae bacterium]MCF8014576.1 two pore domain potassium channel family protein [Chromatiaceae bacterium]MEA1048268.1 ion channel [Lamprobacter modestohalophilus]